MGVDAITVGSQIAVALQSIVSRKLNPADNGIVSITEFITDGKKNVLPGMVKMTGDARALSKETNCIKGGNSTWLNDRPLKKDIELRLNRKIFLENDANCFALAEAQLGAGVNSNLVFGLFIAQLTLNLLWPQVFNSASYAVSLIMLLGMIAFTAYYAMLVYDVSRVASMLVWPYIAWMSFASLINVAYLWEAMR